MTFNDKIYKSKILKDSAVCIDEDFECISDNISNDYTNQQIKCFTPMIPLDDRDLFSSNQIYEVSLFYYDNLSNSVKEIICENPVDCQIIYSNDYTAILKSIQPTNIVVDSVLTLTFLRKLNEFKHFAFFKVL